MSAIDQYIERIADKDLQSQIRREVDRLLKKKSFGLVFEHHMPDNLLTPEVPIRRGTNVVIRNKSISDVYEVQELTDTEATCIQLSSMNEVVLPLKDLVAVAQRGDIIYPYLKPMDSVKNAPDSELWHTLIEADNYHALQLLVYLYAGQVDCIYIDPPYNTGARDWKYNNDYVDGSDSYKHSKWLSMMESRLKIAKKLLNPNDSVLIVTIDEKEYLHLGCLLEQIFPDASIQMITDVIHPSGVARTNQFSRVEEYIFFVGIGSSHPELTSDSMLDFEMTGNYKQEAGDTIPWARMLRRGNNSHREHSQNCFYPIFVNEELGKIDSVGFPPGKGVDRNTVEIPEKCVAVWPMHNGGVEGCWQLSRGKFVQALEDGTAKLGRKNKLGQWSINYLNQGFLDEIKNGNIVVTGRNADGSLILERKSSKLVAAKSVWNRKLHDASLYGSVYLSSIVGKRFTFPKSLYSEADTIRFFVANKPNALILDFFAGSGTTLHAINLLNAEDGGHRRCILVTNNEIGEAKEAELTKQGIHLGDEEWEKWGIARYVTWPRTRCSILGIDVNKKPLEGDYITFLTESKESERKFTQINFLPLGSGQKQKKALVTLINKQKDVKLPTMAEDIPFLVSEDDKCNASILFDVTKIDDYLEALEGNDHITNFYIVTDKDAVYKKVKEEVSQLMGKIEETVPVSMPMKDGFKANAAFFKLGFLDKKYVARGRQLHELLPVLWMKAGAKGECPTKVEGDYVIWPKNHIAILKKESCFRQFRKELENHSEIEVVYIITDSQNAYLAMIDELRGYKTYQLYRDYLENFRINYAIK